jgi:hypothetical protein
MVDIGGQTEHEGGTPDQVTRASEAVEIVPPITDNSDRSQSARSDGGTSGGQQGGIHQETPEVDRDKSDKTILDRIKAGERWMILLTAIVAGSAVFQTVQSCNDNARTAKQVDRIICIASQIGGSAASFSTSAGNIGTEVQDAVGKLNLQAGELAKNADQTNRLARATEEANSNAMQADRPWFGATLLVEGFEVGKVPIATIYFTNSGKRPARIIIAEAHTGYFEVFPKNPPYELHPIVSRGIVVPNAPLVNKFNMSKIPLSETEVSIVESGVPARYFVYAHMEYIDMRLGKPHYANFCWQYIGNVPQLPKGFYACEGYDDAD